MAKHYISTDAIGQGTLWDTGLEKTYTGTAALERHETVVMVTFVEENLTLLKNVPLCCPQCKGNLSQKEETFVCDVCKKRFPIIEGIPDFRVFGDPYLGFEDDYKRSRLIAEHAHRLDFHELLHFYWSQVPETPDPLKKKFIQTVLLSEAKGKGILKELALFSKGQVNPTQNVLEIGCGTGGFLVQAAKTFSFVVGIDIALRWLIVARKRLEGSKTKVPLICCCAEFLPFPNESFHWVVASATLEHTHEQGKVITESHRVLQNSGILFLSTPNRYSLTVEPHTYLWGVGFLPRSWMQRYVHFLKGMDYKHIRLLSYFELKKLLTPVFSKVKFSLPYIDDSLMTHLGRWRKFQVKIYLFLNKLPLFKALLLLWGPMYTVFSLKETSPRAEKRI